MTKIINLYGGPGTGKSTVAADLYALMKWEKISVELVDEYAKQLSWEKRFKTLEDQLYVVASQNRKIQRLVGQVDYIITDSPIIMALPYAKPDYLPLYFKKLVFEVFDTYDNMNFFLNRLKPFHQQGRHHNEEQSKELDSIIKNLLDSNCVDYITVDADENAKYSILQMLRN